MPNDTQQITSKAEVPAWVTETPEPPEPEENWPPYVLMVQEPEGKQIQVVEVTRKEFIALKDVLAQMREYDASEAADAAVESKPEVAAPTNGEPAESISRRLVARTIDGIADRLRSTAEIIYTKGADDSKERLRQHARNEFQADVLLLEQIITDQEGGGFASDFPQETPLIGAIRGNLEL